jgi:hypothetical protein
MIEKLTQLEWEILNAAADDVENLEQIYLSVRFEFVGDGAIHVWRERETAVSLAELADAVRSLVERKLLLVRQDPAEPLSAGDLSYVWRSWFEPTPRGRDLWMAQSEYAAIPHGGL